MSCKALKVMMGLLGLASASIANAATLWNAQDYDLYPGDFNGDGRTDVLYIAKQAVSFSGIAVSDGIGPDTVWQTWAPNYLGIQWYGGQYIALIADFNNDGRSDVLLQRTTPGDSYLLLADATGRLTAISQTIGFNHLGLGWSLDQHSLLPGDVSGDARDDLFLQAATPSGTHAVTLSDSAGFFTAGSAQTFTDGSWPIFRWSRQHAVISIGDFNGDGRADLLVQSRPDILIVDYDVPIPLQVYRSNFFGVVYSQGGSTPFQQSGVQQWSRNQNVVDWSPRNANAVVADFNGDGRDDVLLQARSAGSTSYLLTGNASGLAFSAPAAVASNVSISADSARLIPARFGSTGGAGLYIQSAMPGGTNYFANSVSPTISAGAHTPNWFSNGEIVTYGYDAKGRLTKVARAGNINNNVQTDYSYDKANNRKSIVTTGSPNPPQ